MCFNYSELSEYPPAVVCNSRLFVSLKCVVPISIYGLQGYGIRYLLPLGICGIVGFDLDLSDLLANLFHAWPLP